MVNKFVFYILKWQGLLLRVGGRLSSIRVATFLK